MSGPPRLSVSTNPTGAVSSPSTPGSSLRGRPHGARKRIPVQGLFVANPDEDDVSPKSSPVRSSPVTASSSGSGGRTISSLQSSMTSNTASSSSQMRQGGGTVYPSVPAPNTPVTAFPSPHPAPPTPIHLPHHSSDHYSTLNGPPQPPPHPDRHFHRAFTAPPTENSPTRPHDTRHASLSGVPPASPTRHLPALPSPPHNPTQMHAPSPISSSSNQPPPNSIYSQPDASGSRPQLHHLHTLLKNTSPDEMMNSAQGSASESGRSFASLGSSESVVTRPRAGSVTNKVLLQVTTDNDQFSVVDITGMHTAEAILERVFSKLRFRDDDYATLTLYRTDIGEEPEPGAVSKDTLLRMCQEQGDAKATLKFLVLQTAIPGSTASIVPPTISDKDRHLPPIDTRPQDRTSKDGSLHSASGSSANERQSEWSEVGMEWSGSGGAGGLQRAKQNTRHVERRLPSDSSSSRSLNLIDHNNGNNHNHNNNRDSRTSSPRSFVNVDYPSPNAYHPPRSFTPVQPTAGPSRRNGNGNGNAEAGLGLFEDDGMDPETRALIAQMQKEDEIARQQAEARQAQELADERFARNEQQQERDVWQAMQAMQLDARRQTQEQIELDAQRAREVDAEERRREEERQRQESRQQEPAWRDSTSQNRTANFVNERRALRQEWSQRGDSPQDTWSQSMGQSSSYHGDRRQSETPPYLPGQQQVYTSPSAQFSSEVPSYGRSASRQTSRYDEENSQFSGLRPGERMAPGASMGRRPPSRHPYGYSTPGDYNASLQNARSVDNLRPYGVPPVSRPPQQTMPNRPIQPPSSSQYANYRSPSTERMQDGRYPDPSHSTPMRTAPQIGSVPFPSPQLRRQDSPEQSWLPYAQNIESPRAFDRSRPNSDHYSPPLHHANSPTTATLPQRPSTLYDNSPPRTARAPEEYFPPKMPLGSGSRRNSIDHLARTRMQSEEGMRRASESSAGDPREIMSSPLASSEATWQGTTRSQRTDTSDSASVAGTVSSGVSSEATIRPRRGDEDSLDTARAGGDLQSQWRAMVKAGRGGTLMPTGRVASQSALDDDDGEEATLWITAPAGSRSTTSAQPSPRSPSRPNLTISTEGNPQPVPSLTSASDSNTESEAEDGTKPQRTKSFAKPRDQWYFRPEPEQLYANLDALFPKIDLDKPIVEGMSTPTTPSDTPSSSTNNHPPPPTHPSRQDVRSLTSPKTDKVDRTDKVDIKQATGGDKGITSTFMGRFNKAENRRSIRVVADFARKAIARDNKDKKATPANNPTTESTDEIKLERRKSSSMWGHQVVEVTPSRFAGGQIPAPIPESPTTENDPEGKPPILNWVKGELIGKGSYGRVYIALNVTTGDMMAVKQVELPATDRDRYDDRQVGMIEALRGEIALLKDLYHPNIVQYLGTETSQEYLSIFLEYVPGGTIASIYRAPGQSPFEEQLVKFFTKQILEGLAYLHGKQILHRDLKGDNILVDANGICKISDFGISKQAADAYDSFGQATNMKGSVFWMAPEVIHSANERTYSGKVDIWSLGCVVMEMWTGIRPWANMEQVAAMYQLFNQRSAPPLPPDIEAQMSDVALDFLNTKCLAKEPHLRPTARELLQHRFILETDESWTFAGSKIGKAVASRGMRKMKAHHAAHGSTG